MPSRSQAKFLFTQRDVDRIRLRILTGETRTAVAQAIGISRRGLYSLLTDTDRFLNRRQYKGKQRRARHGFTTTWQDSTGNKKRRYRRKKRGPYWTWKERKDAMKETKRILQVKVGRMVDQDPDPSYLEQEGFEERLAAYRNDEFDFVGVRAEAEIVVGGVTQTVTSAGLWGIESDSSADYLAEVEAEELAELRKVLYAVGFTKRQIGAAWKENGLGKEVTRRGK